MSYAPKWEQQEEREGEYGTRNISLAVTVSARSPDAQDTEHNIT
jgi:hypothetical protein